MEIWCRVTDITVTVSLWHPDRIANEFNSLGLVWQHLWVVQQFTRTTVQTNHYSGNNLERSHSLLPTSSASLLWKYILTVNAFPSSFFFCYCGFRKMTNVIHLVNGWCHCPGIKCSTKTWKYPAHRGDFPNSSWTKNYNTKKTMSQEPPLESNSWSTDLHHDTVSPQF